MNDVTVVTSVTYPSPESLALVADVQYHEPYLSAALNRKFRGIVDPGFYAGFLPKPGGGMNLLITSVDGDKTAGAASVDVGEFYQVTIQHRKDISLALSAGKKYAIVLKGRYLLGEDTYQVNIASHIYAAEFVARTYTDSYQLGDGELLVCTVNIPAGVSAITQEMIDTSKRINRTIGIDISDSVTSTRSDVAASSLAVKKAYDLAKSKYTAQDASTTQKGIVQLSSETDSDSEQYAATPKAIKAVMDRLKSTGSGISLAGSRKVYAGGTALFQITDYSDWAVWSEQVSAGQVMRIGADVAVVVPEDTPAGSHITLTLTRDGRQATFELDVAAPAIDAPVWSSPTTGSTDISLTPTLHTEGFTCHPDGHDWHQQSDWQVATDEAFTDVVWSSMADGEHLTQITLPADTLSVNTRYFARVRFRGASLESGWSENLVFTTVSEMINTPAILSPSDGQEGVGWMLTLYAGAFSTTPASADTHASTDWQISYSPDFYGDSGGVLDVMGDTQNLTKLVVPDDTLSQGNTFYVRVRFHGVKHTSAWSPVVRFSTRERFYPQFVVDTLCPDAGNPHGYGRDVAMSGDSSVMVLSPFPSKARQLAVYQYSYPNWQLVARPETAGAVSGEDEAAMAVAVSRDGKIIVAGVPNASDNSTGKGALYLYDNRSGSGWESIRGTLLAYPETVTGYGRSVALSGQGETVVTGCGGESAWALSAEDNWSSPVALTPPLSRSGAGVGGWRGVAVSDDGQKVVLAETGGNQAHVMENQGGTWQHVATLCPAGVQGNNTLQVAASADLSVIVLSAPENRTLHIFTDSGSGPEETQVLNWTDFCDITDMRIPGGGISLSADGSLLLADFIAGGGALLARQADGLWHKKTEVYSSGWSSGSDATRGWYVASALSSSADTVLTASVLYGSYTAGGDDTERVKAWVLR
ncbi:tail fiber protein [Escherichia coli]